MVRPREGLLRDTQGAERVRPPWMADWDAQSVI